MSRKFSITTPTNLPRVDAEGRAQVQFTVTNTSGAPERRLFRAVPLGDAKESWLSLAGESERTFAADGVHQLSVTASVPPGTAAGRYGFRLDCIAATRAGEEIEEGPAVYFDVAAAAPPKKSLAWVWIAAAILLIAGGAGAWLLMRPAEPQPVATATTPAEAPASGEEVEVTDVATAQLDVADAIRKLQAAGFRTKLKFEQTSEARLGSVIAQSVPGSSRAPRGSAVELTVATAEDESMSLAAEDEQDLSASGAQSLREFFLQQRRVDVPDVRVGQADAISAIRILQISGLRVVLRPESYTTARPGVVVAQQPDPKTEVRVGTPVVVFVAVNGEADLTLSPEQQAHLDAAGERHLNNQFSAMTAALTTTAAGDTSATWVTATDTQ